MAGHLKERSLGDVRGVDEFIPRLLVALAGVLLHHSSHHTALGMEHRQTGADLLGEGEQVELGPEAPVVALLGLLQEGEVLLELVLGRPGRAVDALQLLVLLVAQPVRGR